MKLQLSKLAIAAMLVTSVFAAKAETVLKFGFQQLVGSNIYDTAEKLKNIVEEKTKGEVKIQLFPGGTLGDGFAMNKQVMAGALDLSFAEFVMLGRWIPRAEVVQLPYVITSFKEMQAVYNSSWGQGVIKEAADKFNILFFADFFNGIRQTTSNRPLHSIADFKGLKIRVPKSDPNLNFVKYSGASPVPMNFGEVYLALQTNAIDGQENPLSTIRANKFYEVQKYLALTNHILNDTMISVSKASYNKLTAEQQKILKDAIIKVSEEHTVDVEASEAADIAFFEKQGVMVTKLPVEPFKLAMKPYYAEFNKKIGYNLVEEIQTVISSSSK